MPSRLWSEFMSLKSLLRTVWTAGRGVRLGLPEATKESDPIQLFEVWLDAARQCGLVEPTAMTLATCSAAGQPSARTVLLKDVDERGFVFFTNYESRKAQELSENERAALTFYWPSLGRQVCVTGSVAKVSREESERYFESRPRGSQIGAWASEQSRPLGSRTELTERVRERGSEFEGKDVPVPPFWGGFRLVPTQIQFWQARANRLHDRISFDRSGDGWVATRLYP